MNKGLWGNYNQKVVTRHQREEYSHWTSIGIYLASSFIKYFHRNSGSRHNPIIRLPDLTFIRQCGSGSMKSQNSKRQVGKIAWNSRIKFNRNMGKTLCLRRNNLFRSTGWELLFVE